MKWYNEYLETRQVRESFVRWLLIRKMTFKQQSVVIGLLILAWLCVAPYLVFWVYFFKGALIIGLVVFISQVIKEVGLKNDRY
ncbi:hypothetical protein DOK76_05215 [Vagococcus sp. DIV0080]|uniref:Uncharacterized protein n=1 Tax=Candidatus Vagococcus giribetii TaxID=2230876 RepID=A0ABS3HRV8_9ENTE|nr:hypothetical protein [Vagococcus sp. DIV0080]MBO0476460.1 hypothetical protein [Vagococcus sp. DIV0080]